MAGNSWDHIWEKVGYNWMNSVKTVYTPNSDVQGYKDPYNDTEDDNAKYETYSYVVYGTQLRPTKCVFVPEMPDFFTDEELNTVYHSKEEYMTAIEKYGLVYKNVKFGTADTTAKLLEYATDWIKNNYHGGITSFNISALDLHIIDPEFTKFLVGQRANVVYMDPYLRHETSQTLTVISAEYDLTNPENNNYKIGIPDVALNKVYGDDSKKGGGGGGGDKSSDETDNETQTDLESLRDSSTEEFNKFRNVDWAYTYVATKNGLTDFDITGLSTPNTRDPVSDYVYGLAADILKSSRIEGNSGHIESLAAGYLTATGGLDANKLSCNNANITKLGGQNATLSEKVKGQTGEFNVLDVLEEVTAPSGDFLQLNVDGKPVASLDDIPELPGKVTIVVGGKTYEVLGTEK